MRLRTHSFAGFVFLTACAVTAPLVLGEGYQLHLLIMSAIFAILASSLSLIVGYAGLLSLGHAAFFGIGAYVSALMFLRLGIRDAGGMFGAMIVGAAAAFLIGVVILRVRGNRFVITTLVFTEFDAADCR